MKFKKSLRLFILSGKGMLMGAADLVPGVSGGTIAYITGIYDELIDSISAFNKATLHHILKGNFKAVAQELNLKFLLPVMGGILFALFAFAKPMHYCITYYPEQTWGAFFGLILGSIIILVKEIKYHRSVSTFLWVLTGTLFGYWIVRLIPMSTPDDLWFIFLCGLIGITAMILPGISGSFILLILGKYELITRALKGPFLHDNFLILIVFAMGVALGLISFTKALHFLLHKHHVPTKSFLTGLLIGSLVKIWPFKKTMEITLESKKVPIEINYLPALNEKSLTVFALVLFSFLAIFLLERNLKK
jgi:putative membrane protein